MQWIEYGKSFGEFVQDGHCRPGVQVIYMEQSYGPKRYVPVEDGSGRVIVVNGPEVVKAVRVLIGDRDYQGGIEREEYDVLDREIILRYRVLLTPEQLAAE